MAHQTAAQRLAEANDLYDRVMKYEVSLETIDGVTFNYLDPAAIERYIAYLETRVSREGGRRSRNFSTFGRPQ